MLIKKAVMFFMTAVIIAGVQGCVKDATVKIPKVEPKLVITAFITPQDSLIKLSVTLSQPLYNNTASGQYYQVTNANVVISSALGACVLAYDANFESYVADSLHLKIREGVTYSLLVSTPDGKTATAATTIPQKNISLGLEVTHTPGQINYSVKGTWSDPAGTTDYYALLLQNPSYFLVTGQNQNGIPFSDTVSTIQASSVLIKDSENPGGNLSRTMSFTFSNNYKDSVFIYLLHVSKEYIDYWEKLPTASETGPFTEPVLMYTNVTNGFGIFAGYNKYRLKVVP